MNGDDGGSESKSHFKYPLGKENLSNAESLKNLTANSLHPLFDKYSFRSWFNHEIVIYQSFKKTVIDKESLTFEK